MGSALTCPRKSPAGSAVSWKSAWSLSFSFATAWSARARERSTLSWVLKNCRSRNGFPVLTRASVTLTEGGGGEGDGAPPEQLRVVTDLEVALGGSGDLGGWGHVRLPRTLQKRRARTPTPSFGWGGGAGASPARAGLRATPP